MKKRLPSGPLRKAVKKCVPDILRRAVSMCPYRFTTSSNPIRSALLPLKSRPLLWLHRHRLYCTLLCRAAPTVRLGKNADVMVGRQRQPQAHRTACLLPSLIGSFTNRTVLLCCRPSPADSHPGDAAHCLWIVHGKRVYTYAVDLPRVHPLPQEAGERG